MRISIDCLISALFRSNEHCYYDKIKEEVIWPIDASTAIKENTDQYLTLPLYSHAFLRQEYINKMISCDMIDDLPGLKNYPALPMVIEAYTPTEVIYINKAHNLCEYFNLEYDRSPDCSCETFYSYAQKRQMALAIEWCIKNGFEWYSSDNLSNNQNTDT